MLKKIKKYALVTACVLSMAIPSVSVMAADVEPCAQYSYCGSCDSVGLREYRTVVVRDEPYAYQLCRICGNDVVNIREIRHYYECVNCYHSYNEVEYIYYNACGH